MRILHLITHFDLGGAERVAANIAASTSEGMEYHVAEILRGRSDYTPKFLSELRAAGGCLTVTRAEDLDAAVTFIKNVQKGN